MSGPVPSAVNRADDAITITWSPGHVGRYPARALRLACACAACVEEMSGRPLLDPARVAENVRPESVELVGAYAMRVRWSDGHDTGIFTWERLLQLCPCARCARHAPDPPASG